MEENNGICQEKGFASNAESERIVRLCVFDIRANAKENKVYINSAFAESVFRCYHVYLLANDVFIRYDKDRNRIEERMYEQHKAGSCLNLVFYLVHIIL
ncbi:hypothetical protein MKC73_02020 [[Clostridium] innocuum]|nr:hypothetical protein [[Clostridium] innocuum]